jgi:hypothetical protein
VDNIEFQENVFVLERFLISQQLTRRKKTATSSLSLEEEKIQKEIVLLEPYNDSGPTSYEEPEDPTIRVAIQYS